MLIGDETILGPAECLACGLEWAAVWQLGCVALHCPDCDSNDTVREMEATVDLHAPRTVN